MKCKICKWEFNVSNFDHDLCYLSMSIDDGAEKLPGAPASVHSNHSEDLEEPEATEGGGSEDLASRPQEDDHSGRNDRNDICSTKKKFKK